MSNKSYAFRDSQKFNQYLIRNRTFDKCCGFIKELVKQSTSILDIGCWPGSVTVGFADANPSATVIGVDFNESQLEVARSYTQHPNRENLSFEQGSIHELPFEDNSFDLIFCQTVFVHISDHEKALSEIMRVLKPNGIFASREVMNSYIVMTPVSDILEKARRAIHIGVTVSGGAPDVGLFMGEKLHTAGFDHLNQSLFWERSPVGEESREHFINMCSALLYGELGKQSIKNGWITANEINELEKLCFKLPDIPYAMWGMPFVETIARKH